LQLSRETIEANVIRAFENGRIRIGESTYAGHLIVAPDRIVADWSITDANALQLDDFTPVLEMEPEIVLLGTGASALPDVSLMAQFAERAIGLEIMSTAAACRTYNVLVHEYRRVVAALLNEPPSN
jgi:uncharacterized protein